MTRHPDFYLFLFGSYKIIRIFETTSRKSSRSKILKIIWYFTHLLDKIFTFDKTNSFILFSLTQIIRIFALRNFRYGISVTEIP